MELEELEQQLCHGDAFRKELLQGGDGDGQEQQQEQQVKAEIHSHSHYYLVQVISKQRYTNITLHKAEDGSIMELPGLTNQPMEVLWN